LLTNFIPPYWLPTFRTLATRLTGFRVLISTPMEPNRNWDVSWGGLPVRIQKTWTVPFYWRHELGFKEKTWRHFPYDTLPLLIRERPDVVISAQLGFRTMQAALYRRIFSRSRLIVWLAVSEHTERGLSGLRVLERRALLRCADAVLVNGASGAKYVMGLGVPTARIFSLPCCAEITRHLELPLERDARQGRRLLYVGQLVDRKGLGPLLKALSEWLAPRPTQTCEFWIAGDGPTRPDLERLSLCPRLQLSFLGNVPYGKLPEVYAKCGVLVFPTLADEWGVVVNEALASGLPVLGSLYSQAVAELIQDGKTGWLFRTDHPGETYAAVDRAMSTPLASIQAMRPVCRERIKAIDSEFGADCFLRAVQFAAAPPDLRRS
jgi:glycosyltransferase involved in cell wall biosynthesis